MNIKKLIKQSMVAALALTFTQTAFAGGPIQQCGVDQPLVWANDGQSIPFNPDQGPLGPVDNVGAIAAVTEAFAVWQAVSTSTASYVNAGALPVDVDITNFGPYLNPVAPDGLSAIVFDDTGEIFDSLFGAGSGILGFAGPEWVDNTNCIIVEGVSFLNGPSFTDPVSALDVMVHEFGHYSGMGHTVVNGQMLIGVGDTSGPTPDDPFGSPDPLAETIATMYPFYFGPTAGTRTLHQDDMAAISALYPDASFDLTASISGTIYLPNGTTPITGVNVIARNEIDPFNDASSAISGDVNLDGTYTIEGLTPGASYRVYIDEILAGGFSTTLDASFPNNEEYYNGANESNNITSADPVTDFTLVTPGSSGIDIIANMSAPGEPLPVGDDGSIELTLPFEYGFCGESYNSVFVNANGNVSFGAANGDFSESANELLSGPPRIAALWDDLDPSSGGIVTYTQTQDQFNVVYEDVPEFSGGNANSFTISFRRFNNALNISYGNIDATDGLAGVTCGGTVNSGFESASDLSVLQSEQTRLSLNKTPALFEIFSTGNDVDLANSALKFDTNIRYNDAWSESNETIDTATPIDLPFDSTDLKMYTSMGIDGDVDIYQFDTAGALFLNIDIVTGQLDSVISLFDSTGNLLAQDDDGGTGLLSSLSVSDLPPDSYFLLVTSFNALTSEVRYVLQIEESNSIPLSLGDDASEELALGFSFSFNGNSYDSVFVNSNGNLTFGAGDTDFSESVTELLSNEPRIAPLWNDLSPNQGGTVSADFSVADQVTISFDSVPQFLAGDNNTFSVVLNADGSYAINYGTIDSTGGLVGASEGNGASDPGEVDMSTGGLNASGTSYELFDAGDNDLGNISLDFDL